MIGLKRGTVQLVPHNPKWQDIFEDEKKLLLKALGDLVVDIQHIGSTAIPGIPAKPIIDVSIGLRNLKDIKKCTKILESLGYVWREERTQPGHYLFVKGPEENRTHHLHVMKHNSKTWEEDLLFRDYLRTHTDQTQKYAALKKELAEEFSEDRGTYTSHKKNFIEGIIKLAKVR